MKPTPAQYAGWEQTIGLIRNGMSRAEAEKILGEPSRKVFSGDFEILAYHAEQIGDGIYSIRVAYEDDRVTQCYMGYEACEGDARSKRQKPSERMQLLIVVLITAIAFLIFYLVKTRW